MFNRSGYKLNADIRKILMLTNDLYQSPISEEESQSIKFMWNKILGINAIILVSRFAKEKIHFGFRITTTPTERGFQHEIVEIVTNSDISQHTQMEKQDILLEMNGVNLLQLNYSELSVLLHSLPVHVQIVYSKKENEYEKLDLSRDDKSQCSKNLKAGWICPVTIIIQGSRKEPNGLEFINNQTSSVEIISKCVIQRINSNGYFFKDKRVSVNDSILRINNIGLDDFRDKDMYKFFLSNRKSVFLIRLGKYRTNTTGYLSDAENVVRCKSTLPESIDMNDIGPRRMTKSQNSISSPISNYFLNEEDPKNRGLQLTIDVERSDDLGIYLVDIKDSQTIKSIICDFKEDSKLKEKFNIWDEIIKINGEDVEDLSSLEIGKILKICHSKYDRISVTIYRGSKLNNNCNTIFIPPESNLSNEVVPKVFSEPNSITASKESILNQQVFNITLNKINNSFGLFIQNANGPTITKVISDSEIYKKHILKPGDKIVRINDIYVLDKDHNFVLTLIRSCGKTMHLEIFRICEENNHVDYMWNPIYYSHGDFAFEPSMKTEEYPTEESQSEKSSPKMSKIKNNMMTLNIKSV